jgi:NAD(P)-dependent dehydrogenase (short-subunit alcohol dehydrogenase family)
MSRDLEGKVALVTGSCIGLGAAIARVFAREGARVVVTGLPEDRGRALAAELGGGALFLPANLLDAAQTRGLVRETLRLCGGLDILVNNAAISDRATLEEVTPELFDRQMHLIVRAPILLAQEALASLKARTGCIVNVASVNAYMGWQNLLVYASAKAALVAASKNLANALKYARVRVYCLNPGWIDTEGERSMMERLGHGKDFLDREGRELPLGRLLKPEEVAEAALFLASPKGAPFSGQVLELEQYPLGAMCHPKHTEPMQ